MASATFRRLSGVINSKRYFVSAAVCHPTPEGRSRQGPRRQSVARQARRSATITILPWPLESFQRRLRRAPPGAKLRCGASAMREIGDGFAPPYGYEKDARPRLGNEMGCVDDRSAKSVVRVRQAPQRSRRNPCRRGTSDIRTRFQERWFAGLGQLQRGRASVSRTARTCPNGSEHCLVRRPRPR